MCTAGAPRPPHTAGPRAGGRAQSEPAVDAPGPARVPVRTSSARARRGHGRAPRGPLSAGARAVLRLGRAGRRLPEAGRRVPESLPVLPHHRALHASAAGGRARRGAADLHPVSAAGRGARGRRGPGSGRTGAGCCRGPLSASAVARGAGERRARGLRSRLCLAPRTSAGPGRRPEPRGSPARRRRPARQLLPAPLPPAAPSPSPPRAQGTPPPPPAPPSFSFPFPLLQGRRDWHPLRGNLPHVPTPGRAPRVSCPGSRGACFSGLPCSRASLAARVLGEPRKGLWALESPGASRV